MKSRRVIIINTMFLTYLFFFFLKYLSTNYHISLNQVGSTNTPSIVIWASNYISLLVNVPSKYFFTSRTMTCVLSKQKLLSRLSFSPFPRKTNKRTHQAYLFGNRQLPYHHLTIQSCTNKHTILPFLVVSIKLSYRW